MNIADQINEVIRHVDFDDERNVVSLTQTFPTSPADLWDACTDPARLARWFETVEGDLELGGRYRMTDSGTVGTITRCEAPSTLEVTWEHGDDVSHVHVKIEPADAATSQLTIRHTGEPGESWQQYGPAAGGSGWDAALLGLAILFDDADSTLDEVNRLFTRAEGATFVRRAIDAWSRAYQEAGASQADADAAADRAYALDRELSGSAEDDEYIKAEVTHRFAASAEEVFDAWLDPRAVTRWLAASLRESMPDTELLEVEIDARVGGEFRFVDSRDAEQEGPTGTYLEIDRPRRLVFTWLPEGEERSVVTIDIQSDGDGCVLTLVHEMEPIWIEYLDRTQETWARMVRQVAADLA